MSNIIQQDKEIREELAKLEEEIKDCERSVKREEESIKSTQEDLGKSLVWYAKAIIKLNVFKKANNL